jgi:hypothetical protein
MESTNDTFAIITFSVGTLGFIYGLYATSQLHNLAKKVEQLEEEMQIIRSE